MEVSQQEEWNEFLKEVRAEVIRRLKAEEDRILQAKVRDRTHLRVVK